jgi:hypothetical protein
MTEVTSDNNKTADALQYVRRVPNNVTVIWGLDIKLNDNWLGLEMKLNDNINPNVVAFTYFNSLIIDYV